MNSYKTIGMVYAICDHFEQSTGKPVLSNTLKSATGVSRSQLREWVREGRLAEYNITSEDGQLQKGYSRPKAERRDENASTSSQEEVH